MASIVRRKFRFSVPIKGAHVLLVLLAVLFCGVEWRLWFGNHGLLALRHKEAQLQEMTEQNAALLDTERQLQARLAALEKPSPIMEAMAREKLDLVGPNEVLYRMATPR
jgi:cell division protein FtsB